MLSTAAPTLQNLPGRAAVASANLKPSTSSSVRQSAQGQAWSWLAGQTWSRACLQCPVWSWDTCCAPIQKTKQKTMVPPRLELGIFRVWGERIDQLSHGTRWHMNGMTAVNNTPAVTSTWNSTWTLALARQSPSGLAWDAVSLQTPSSLLEFIGPSHRLVQPQVF